MGGCCSGKVPGAEDADVVPGGVNVKSSCGKGLGDLETVVLRHSGAVAEVYLWGATLCSYRTPDGQERIFCSPAAVFDGQKAIRGGVPLVFPQFGQESKAMAQHGFARTSMWSCDELVDGTEESHAVFTLRDSEATRSQWKYPFLLEYKVSLTVVSLNLSLRVVNTGETGFSFQALLHTYLRVPDVKDAKICGLAGQDFIDKVRGGQNGTQLHAELDLPAFTDRVFLGKAPIPRHLTVKSKDTTSFAVECEGRVAGEVKACDVVIWNPYEEASPGDLPPPAYKEFVCVEPGLVGELLHLKAGTEAQLRQKIVPV